MKIFLFLLPALFFVLGSFAQSHEPAGWSLPEVEKARQKDPRLIVMQLTTEGCVYCKMQARQLSRDTQITRLLKEDTYYLHLEAATKDTIRFNQTLYSPSVYKNGLHDFTLAVSGKTEPPSFPMWVIFNKENEIVYRQNGLVKPKILAGVLKGLL